MDGADEELRKVQELQKAVDEDLRRKAEQEAIARMVDEQSGWAFTQEEDDEP